MVGLATHEHARFRGSGEQQSLDAPLFYLAQQYWDEPQNRDSSRPPNNHVGPPIDPWTFRDAFGGTQIFGGTGSGKTTGSGRTLALAFLTARFRGEFPFGGLVLCAKPEEVDLWANFASKSNVPGAKSEPGYCALAGRSPEDVIVLGERLEHYRKLGLSVPQGGYFFDYQNYMQGLRREGGEGAKTSGMTQGLVNLFMTVLEGGREGGNSADPYWDDAIRQMLANAIDLLILVGRPVDISTIGDIILAAPQSRAETKTPVWQRDSLCWELLEAAHVATSKAFKGSREGDPAYEARRDFKLVRDYWLKDFAGLTERVRSVVESSFTSKATAILRSPMRRLFATAASRKDGKLVTPTDTHRGKIVILDLSVKEYGETGRFAQVLFKTVWQRATEHPSRDQFSSPVFLWADESQYFITSQDAVFQQTARSKRAATVYLTQNISNYYVALGGRSGNAATDSLIGNFQTKIFHANGDPATNEWAERLFGHELKSVKSSGVGYGGGAQGGVNTQKGESSQWLPAVPISTFLGLRRGGGTPSIVEGYVLVAGRPRHRPMNTDNPTRTGIRVHFDQNVVPLKRG